MDIDERKFFMNQSGVLKMIMYKLANWLSQTRDRVADFLIND